MQKVNYINANDATIGLNMISNKINLKVNNLHILCEKLQYEIDDKGVFPSVTFKVVYTDIPEHVFESLAELSFHGELCDIEVEVISTRCEAYEFCGILQITDSNTLVLSVGSEIIFRKIDMRSKHD
jgi:hypothetical protein